MGESEIPPSFLYEDGFSLSIFGVESLNGRLKISFGSYFVDDSNGDFRLPLFGV